MTPSTGFFIAYAVPEREWTRLRAELAERPPGSSQVATSGAPEFVPNGVLQLGNKKQLLFPKHLVAKRSYERLQRLAQNNLISQEATLEVSEEEWFPILDVCWQFERIINLKQFGVSKDADSISYVEDDGGREILFSHTDDTTTIQSNVFKDITVTVPTSELRAVMQQFVIDVVADVVRYAPAALEWDTLAPLRRYVHAE